ncbi:MAG: cellulase family glycosylhydrolase [Candidatus Omnitrophica bacterium]|nr:cellulase family glycosylhydrolase [Candidatus Omnitrophota bacterium]
MKTAVFAIAIFLLAASAEAGQVFQDFEPDNGSTYYGSAGGGASSGFSSGAGGGFVKSGYPLTQCGPEPLAAEPVHGGRRAWKVESYAYWNTTSIEPQTGVANFDPTKNDRLTFWILSIPRRDCFVYGWSGPTENTVGVRVFDQGAYAEGGFEVWTTKTARYAEWTQLGILFSQLPADFDLAHVTRIEIKNYSPGAYYLDDIAVVREDRVYSAFEPELRAGSGVGDFGWKWVDADSAGFSASGEPAHEGAHSWKLISTQKWGGTGLQSQEQRLDGLDQTFWRVDLNPALNDRLTLWVYAQPENGLDNTLNVQFYDHGAHFTDQTKVEFWTKQTIPAGRWTKITVPFNALPQDLNLRDLNKIQIQFYWPGTYYLDDIRATGPDAAINDPTMLRQGGIHWQPVPSAGLYRVQENLDGPESSAWRTIYEGSDPVAPTTALSRRWFRARWEEAVTAGNPLPYMSDWSEAVEYLPPPVLIDPGQLKAGFVTSTTLPQTQTYELQYAMSRWGPWTSLPGGPFPPVGALPGQWYRVRGVRDAPAGELADATPWSPPLQYTTTPTYIKTSGTQLKDENGTGQPVHLQGVNLGGWLLIEPWMTGLGTTDANPIEDDWTIRDVLGRQYGAGGTDAFLSIYQQSYLQEADLDAVMRMGLTFVRLPIYYRNLQDDAGNWIRDAQGHIDFSRIDWLIQACKARGISVLLDLHGAPGGQSLEFHTGRKNFSKLFDAVEGPTYQARTIEFWRQLATQYKDEPAVVGYDLLNEPFGAPTNQTLWDFYAQLYLAIRAVDPHHLIVMMGKGDWDSLPPPASMGWQNVMYQFHYYNFGYDEDVASHRAFIDGKVALAAAAQPTYQVPVLIGEFNAFSQKGSWDYALQTFNVQGWNWANWTLKDHSHPSNWGLFTHAGYTAGPIKIRNPQDDATPGDSLFDLQEKLRSYDTLLHHVPNVSLINTLSAQTIWEPPSGNGPAIQRLEPAVIGPGGSFCAIGVRFGGAQGPGAVLFEGTLLPVVSWSDTQACVYVTTQNNGRSIGEVTVQTAQGTSDGLLLRIVSPSGITGMSGGGVGSEITFTGTNFGDFGSVRFYWTSCIEIPTIEPLRPCNRGRASIVSWSQTQVRAIVPADAAIGPVSVGGAGGFYNGRVNRPPVPVPVPPQSVDAGGTLQFTIDASDPDNDPLTFSLVRVSLTLLRPLSGTAPSDLTPATPTFDPVTRTFSWSPTHAQWGSYEAVFNISDPGGLSATLTVPITVVYVAQSPVLAPIGDKTISEGQALTFTVTATDVNGDVLTFSANPLPLGATFAADTQTFSWTPTYAQAGTVVVTFTVTDIVGLTDSESVSIIVSDVTRPDLLMSALSTTATSARPGSSIMISNAVKNQGAVASTSLKVVFHLSTDASYGGSDDMAFTATRALSTLGIGATSAVNTSVTVPATTPLGAYVICAMADGEQAVVETDESNNSRCTNTTLQVTKPDLVMQSVVGSATGLTGATISLTDTVQNQGAVGATAFYVGYYLSTDAMITTADRRIGYRYLSSLGANTPSTGTTVVTIPSTLAPATYYLGALADYAGNSSETNETNNALAGNQIVITPGADLLMTALSSGGGGVTGGPLPVAFTVLNQGTGTTTDFYIGLYLSADATITTGDVFLGYRYVGTLAAGASSALTQTVTIPATLAPGTYILGAMADYTNRRVESHETNNSLAANAVVVSPGADLVMTTLTTSATAVTGSTLAITNTVTNQGIGAASSFYVGFYLSADPLLGPGDLLLGSRSLNSLAVGASSTATTTLPVSAALTPATYSILAKADFTNARVETNETNNTLATATPVTITPGADLVMTALTGPASATRGQAISLSSTVRNQGVGSAASFYVGLYLSTDSVITSGDRRLGYRSINSLAAGASNGPISINVTIPTAVTPATYYLGAIADDTRQRTESNETNNALAGATIVVN